MIFQRRTTYEPRVRVWYNIFGEKYCLPVGHGATEKPGATPDAASAENSTANEAAGTASEGTIPGVTHTKERKR
jgi:hypothetical protein